MLVEAVLKEAQSNASLTLASSEAFECFFCVCSAMGEERAAAWENMGGEAIMVPGMTSGGGGDIGAPPMNR